MTDEPPEGFDWDAYHAEAEAYFEALDHATNNFRYFQQPVEIPAAVVIRPNFIRRFWRWFTKG